MFFKINYIKSYNKANKLLEECNNKNNSLITVIRIYEEQLKSLRLDISDTGESYKAHIIKKINDTLILGEALQKK